MGKLLCDSGASINLMPLSVVKRLSLGELTPTIMTMQMADKTLAQPKGLLPSVFSLFGDQFGLKSYFQVKAMFGLQIKPIFGFFSLFAT